ncbi:hypothetical protein AX774_g6760 [Zancudomyces culisetae]|uniref:Uncharacterized protein n=1 Tax=Zancudomyces culisetae TaxID=1213189 RepID=A0A1R1PFN0_ZANCU|nr:hypothetical protein AX774_g6760 [Zancudomyces culisetae]|eukprot:OMH79815.1 hypothetical protein AX774_g6760 [Zancudomyces culisetae]
MLIQDLYDIILAEIDSQKLRDFEPWDKIRLNSEIKNTSDSFTATGYGWDSQSGNSSDGKDDNTTDVIRKAKTLVKKVKPNLGIKSNHHKDLKAKSPEKIPKVASDRESFREKGKLLTVKKKILSSSPLYVTRKRGNGGSKHKETGASGADIESGETSAYSNSVGNEINDFDVSEDSLKGRSFSLCYDNTYGRTRQISRPSIVGGTSGQLDSSGRNSFPGAHLYNRRHGRKQKPKSEYNVLLKYKLDSRQKSQTSKNLAQLRRKSPSRERAKNSKNLGRRREQHVENDLETQLNFEEKVKLQQEQEKMVNTIPKVKLKQMHLEKIDKKGTTGSFWAHLLNFGINESELEMLMGKNGLFDEIERLFLAKKAFTLKETK